MVPLRVPRGSVTAFENDDETEAVDNDENKEEAEDRFEENEARSNDCSDLALTYLAPNLISHACNLSIIAEQSYQDVDVPLCDDTDGECFYFDAM